MKNLIWKSPDGKMGTVELNTQVNFENLEKGLIENECTFRVYEEAEIASRMLESGSENLNLDDKIKKLMLKALDEADWVQYKAAKLLGIKPRVMNYKCRQFDITHESWYQTGGNPKLKLIRRQKTA